MAAITRAPQAPEHTVGLTLNAKGDVQIEVTGRGSGSLSELAESVAATFDKLREQYPRDAALPKGVSPTTKDKGPSDEVPF